MAMELPTSTKESFAYSGSKGSVLLFHGFTGTPYDLLPLGLFLKNHGFSAIGPALPGHATSASDLNKVGFESWLKLAENHLKSLGPGEPRILTGLSMGGDITTILAARFPALVDGLILLAPAFHLRGIGKLATKLSEHGLHRILPLVKKAGGGCDAADPEARKLCPSYQHIPLKGLLELEKVRILALEAIEKVKCPVFVALGQHDNTVDNKAISAELKRFDVPVLKTHVLSKSRHVLPLDYDREDLANLILAFCEDIS